LIKGTVSKTFEKDWDGRDGKVVLHSFQLQGDQRYFRTGTDRLFSQGDAVQFEIGNNNTVVGDSVVKLEASVQTAPPAATGGGGQRSWSGGGGYKAKQAEKDAYWSDKEARDIERERRQHEIVEPRITWSSARTAAIDVVGLALQHDAIAFGNAAKGAKLGMILDFVDEVSARFYSQSMAAAETAAGLEYSATEKDLGKKAKGAAQAVANDE
jgi:hypothetical protein